MNQTFQQRLAFCATGLVLGLSACSVQNDKTPEDVVAYDRAAMLAELGEFAVWPQVQAFAAESAKLEVAVGGWCTALGSGGDAAGQRTTAQSQWRATMRQWAVVSTFRFGPLTMDGGILADRIYSWPVASACAVDQEVMTWRADQKSYALDGKLPNRKGLDALEALLFRSDLATACPPQAAPAGWDSLSDPDRWQARCGYAKVVAADLRTAATALQTAWDPAQGGYLVDLKTVGTPAGKLGTVREVTNGVSDALFLAEKAVKDVRLAKPAGITTNTCGTVQEVCLADLESPYAGASQLILQGTCDGMTLLFAGNLPGQPERKGFDDYLTAVGGGEVALNLAAALAGARTAIDTLPQPQDTGLQTGRDKWVAAHNAAKAVTDLLKTQFLTVLGLDLPAAAATDND